MKVLQVLKMYCFLQFCTSLLFCLQTLAAGRMNCERESFKLFKIVNFGRFWEKNLSDLYYFTIEDYARYIFAILFIFAIFENRENV